MADAIRSMDLGARPFDDMTIDTFLQNVAFGLRATYHTSLLASPGQIVFGRDMVINAAYVANWKRLSDLRATQALKNNTRENKKRRPHTYNVDDTVYIRNTDITKKLDPMKGPFKIVQVHTNGTVTIQRSVNVRERINIRRLHPGSSHFN